MVDEDVEGEVQHGEGGGEEEGGGEGTEWVFVVGGFVIGLAGGGGA